jgi:Cys-rich repeat protein
MTSHLFLRGSLATLFALGALGVARTAGADPTSCAADSDCTKGFTCQVVGATACAGTACAVPPAGADAEACPPPPVCDPTVIKGCMPGPCTTDSDCATGMVCYADTYTSCPPPEPVPICPKNADCAAPAIDAGVCTTTTMNSCVPRYDLPCKVASDCGDGFTCAPDTTTECSGGGLGRVRRCERFDGNDLGACRSGRCIAGHGRSRGRIVSAAFVHHHGLVDLFLPGQEHPVHDRRQLSLDMDVRRAAGAGHRDLCGPRQLRRRGCPLWNSRPDPPAVALRAPVRQPGLELRWQPTVGHWHRAGRPHRRRHACQRRRHQLHLGTDRLDRRLPDGRSRCRHRRNSPLGPSRPDSPLASPPLELTQGAHFGSPYSMAGWPEALV